MPEYLATVRGADGRETTENVEANSADEAVRQLREQGFEEIVLHTDDVGAHYTNQRKVASSYSPRDFLLLRNLPLRVGLFVVTTSGLYRKLWPVMIPLAILCAAILSRGGPRGPTDWFCLASLAIPIFFALLRTLLASGRAQYEKMLDALYWGRWEEAITRVDGLAARLPADEVAFRKAEALAALGRLDEGLDLVERFDDERLMPRWLYLSRLSDLYDFINRHDDSIALLEEAVGLAPDNATILLSLAGSYIWYRRDPRRARELIARARTHAISDLLEPYAEMLDGLVLLEERKPQEALPILESANATFLGREHMILGYLFLDRSRLALALAHAAIGDRDTALALYGKVRPRHAAIGSSLVPRCDREIGVP